MFRKQIYILAFSLALISSSLQAQNSQVLYYMNLPQNHMLNPAFRPTNSTYVGLPGMSGVSVNASNNLFNFSDVFLNGVVPDSVVTIFHPDADPSNLIKKIKNINSLEPEILVQLLGIGFTVGKDLYIFLDINERAEANAAIPGDIIKLGFEGNEQFVGKTIDLSSLRGDVRYYREIGLGFSRNFSEKLRLGLKAKTLFGVASASIDNNSLAITVNDDYTHSLNADLNVNVSAPLSFYISGQNTIDSVKFDDSRFDGVSNILSYLFDTKNLGFGIDIGAEYKINDRIKVSASVTDLGYIKWKKDISNLKAKSEFVFSGIDMLDVYNGTMNFDSLGTELLDSLKNSFYLTDTKSAFTTYLPFGVSAGGSYNVTKSISLGLVSYTRFIGKQVRESLTLSANANFGNIFSTTIAYTAMNHRYDNLGLGIAVRAGCFQFYALADRIPVSWNKIVTEKSTFPVPSVWNTINARVGLNLVFGNNIAKKQDKPMVMVEEGLPVKEVPKKKNKAGK